MENIEKKIIKPPVLYRQTQQIIKKIENKEQVKLLSYWNSVNGEICQSDVSVFLKLLKIGKYKTGYTCLSSQTEAMVRHLCVSLTC